jgi:hypothetical protein
MPLALFLVTSSVPLLSDDNPPKLIIIFLSDCLGFVLSKIIAFWGEYSLYEYRNYAVILTQVIQERDIQ